MKPHRKSAQGRSAHRLRRTRQEARAFALLATITLMVWVVFGAGGTLLPF